MRSNVLKVFGFAAVDVAGTSRLKSCFSISATGTMRANRSTSICFVKTSTILCKSCARSRSSCCRLSRSPCWRRSRARPYGRMFFIDHDNTSGDTRAVEEVGRQSNDAFDVALANDRLPYLRLGVATEQHAMWENDGPLPCALQRCEYVKQEGVVAILVWRRRREALIDVVSWFSCWSMLCRRTAGWQRRSQKS